MTRPAGRALCFAALALTSVLALLPTATRAAVVVQQDGDGHDLGRATAAAAAAAMRLAGIPAGIDADADADANADAHLPPRRVFVRPSVARSAAVLARLRSRGGGRHLLHYGDEAGRADEIAPPVTVFNEDGSVATTADRSGDVDDNGGGPVAVAAPTDVLVEVRGRFDHWGRRRWEHAEEAHGMYGGKEWAKKHHLPDPDKLARDLAGEFDDADVDPDTGRSGDRVTDIDPTDPSAEGGAPRTADDRDRDRRVLGAGDDPCAATAASAAAAGAARAEYSPLFETPVCDARGRSSCVASGLNGKGAGSEMYAPNTLYGECPDGAPSRRGYVAEVSVAAQGGGVLRSGRLGAIRASVVCAAAPAASFVDFFYTGDASMTPNRTWILLSSTLCTARSDLRDRPLLLNLTSPAFIIPEGVLDTTFVARVQVRRATPGSVRREVTPCLEGTRASGDRDDVVIRVCPPAAAPAPAPSGGRARSLVEGGGDGDGSGGDPMGFRSAELQVEIDRRGSPTWGMFAARRGGLP